MTKQEILDKQWDWFIVQDKPFGMSAEGSCKYRGLEGSRCAAGLLIPDEKYVRDMESWGLSNIAVDLGWDPEILGFILKTQGIHDRASRYDWGDQKYNFAENLRILAIEHNLTIPGDPS